MNSSATMSPTMRTLRVLKPVMSVRSRSSRMTQDPADSTGEVVHDGIGDQASGYASLLYRTITGAHEDAAATDGVRQLHVQPAIADHEGPGRIDAEGVGSAIHH